MTPFTQSRVILLSIFSAVYLGPAAPVYSYKPSKEIYEKCYSKKSIPTHFEKATDVVAASYQGSTETESLGFYKIEKVWKGTKSNGSTIRFQLPCYDRKKLMEPGTTYLFFLVATTETKHLPDPVYKLASCKPIHQVTKYFWTDSRPDGELSILRDLEKELKGNKK